jgi:hypothetical protein
LLFNSYNCPINTSLGKSFWTTYSWEGVPHVRSEDQTSDMLNLESRLFFFFFFFFTSSMRFFGRLYCLVFFFFYFFRGSVLLSVMIAIDCQLTGSRIIA